MILTQNLNSISHFEYYFQVNKNSYKSLIASETWKNMCLLIVSTLPADGIPTLYSGLSPGTVMIIIFPAYIKTWDMQGWEYWETGNSVWLSFRIVWWVSKPITTYLTTHIFRDYFVYAPNQWETTLQCNIVYHWLGAYTKRSLCFHFNKKLKIMWKFFLSSQVKSIGSGKMEFCAVCIPPELCTNTTTKISSP